MIPTAGSRCSDRFLFSQRSRRSDPWARARGRRAAHEYLAPVAVDERRWTACIAWLEVGALDDIPRRGARELPRPHGAGRSVPHRDDRVFALMTGARTKVVRCHKGIVHGSGSPARCTTGSSAWTAAAEAPDEGCTLSCR